LNEKNHDKRGETIPLRERGRESGKMIEGQGSCKAERNRKLTEKNSKESVDPTLAP
jgi:hypothetical protein